MIFTAMVGAQILVVVMKFHDDYHYTSVTHLTSI